ncbi:MAG TPA: hypothetical protein VLZ29_09630 [Sulfurimonas sp.]|jgi:hypothetical protein|uniref:hypothetical protein n=1 Tax=Sulfurimonas sp. TaxID=2022749 RepID=UPI002D1A0DF7|nr:hypothetical protein [Sulfurimonas sp.]HUH43369.1 hypothetical protein [Sulfurimonas sp.]
MKTTLTILLTLLLSNNLLSSELDWVNEQIEAIKPPRKGVVVTGVSNPFVFLKKNMPKDSKKETSSSSTQKSSVVDTGIEKPKKEVISASTFDLSAIINSSAMINGSWYKVDDVVKGYTISEITKDSVILKKDKKLIFLSTTAKKQTLKFKNK